MHKAIQTFQNVAPADTLHLAQIEIRDLKTTIAALRDELEKSQRTGEHMVQATRAASSDEVNQLRGTITALRAELDRTIFQQVDALAHRDQAAHDEAQQLRETIAILRLELERKDDR